MRPSRLNYDTSVCSGFLKLSHSYGIRFGESAHNFTFHNSPIAGYSWCIGFCRRGKCLLEFDICPK